MCYSGGDASGFLGDSGKGAVICGRAHDMHLERRSFSCEDDSPFRGSCGTGFFYAQEVVDYRAILERAFEVVATGSMEYEGSVGMSLGKGRVKSIVSQLRNADGTVCRKIECLRNGGRVLRGDLSRGYLSIRSTTRVKGIPMFFVTRTKAYGIRTREGGPRKRISRGWALGFQKRRSVCPVGFSAWIARRDMKELWLWRNMWWNGLRILFFGNDFLMPMGG